MPSATAQRIPAHVGDLKQHFYGDSDVEDRKNTMARHDLAVRLYEKSTFIYNALRRSPNTYHNGRAIAYENSFPKAIGERQMDQPRSERTATDRGRTATLTLLRWSAS